MMSMIIVGAGMSGLHLARSIGSGVTVLEKSRGVGGRVATRRTETAKFDHGAQFYSLKDPIRALHEEWIQIPIVKPWFKSREVQRFMAIGGMTTIAKNLASGLDIRFETRAVKLNKIDRGWNVACDNGAAYEAEKVVLTCPLPQSLELFNQSSIAFDPALSQIRYAKALIGLFENVTSSLNLPSGFIERPGSGNIVAIADQKAKGLSENSAWFVVMSPEFSEPVYEKTDEEIMAMIENEIRIADPGVKHGHAQLKKWRYGHPLSIHPTKFVEPVPGLYIAGDAFGGGSINGAVASATALATHFTESRGT